MGRHELKLRYGTNPHQTPASAYAKSGQLPLRVLNGAPSYVNLLDALNSWALVRELRQVLGMAAAASFKHVSPAGVAVGRPLSERLRRAYFVEGLELSPLAAAYARARGADRVSSFGDWAALSDPVDRSTAEVLRREVSDGLIAPGYEPEALRILGKKKEGRYALIEIDPAYEPDSEETREVFGITLQQKRNDFLPTRESLDRVATRSALLPAEAAADALLALLALKYTQSNSVCFVLDGQVIGIAAGQQSRIHSTRLAAAKAETWYLRQHPKVLEFAFREEVRRPERDNAIDQYLREDLSATEEQALGELLVDRPARLTADEKRAWLSGLSGVTLGSDAYIPFRDSIDRAARLGVRYVVQPGGSVRDAEVIAACEEYGMTMVHSGVRLFHH